MMKVLTALILGFTVASANASIGKAYQVTGSVVDVNDKVITIQKDKEKWEIAREPGTIIRGEPKKGNKVTVQYRMTASNIEVKGENTQSKTN